MGSGGASEDLQALKTLTVGPPVEDGPRAIAPGMQVGRYMVIERAGAGGMGEVYRAYDPKLHREVALKLVRLGLGGERAVDEARLLREAQAMARLSHPNTMPVYDADTWGSNLFIAMEFVVGETLGKWLEGTRTTTEILDALVDAGKGLEAAHAAGIIHRDFKPANVLVGRDGRVRVMDFGLARGTDAPRSDDEPSPVSGGVGSSDTLSGPLTRVGTLVGTIPYMAPEQHRDEAQDARTDQFAFCVTAYEALFGVRPFGQGSATELRDRKERLELQTPTAMRRVPPRIRKAILVGLSPNPEERWPEMRPLIEALAYRPTVRRWAFPAGALLLGGLALWGFTRGSGAACELPAEALEGVWDAHRRAQVETQVNALDLPYANDTSQRLRAVLDGYGRDWTEARREACEATHVRREQSAELFDRRMACLEVRRSALAGLTDLLLAADRDVVEHAVEAAGNLPAIEPCGAADYLLAEVRPPSDPAVAARVQDVRERLGAARAVRDAARYEDAQEAVLAIVEEATSLGYAPALAEARLDLGRIKVREGDFAAAEELTEDAYHQAVASRHRRVALEAAITLVFVDMRLAHADLAQRWVRIARAELEGIGGDLDAEARLIRHEGLALEMESRFVEALDRLQRARELFVELHGAEHATVADTDLNLGAVLHALDRRDEAVAAYRRAIDAFEATLGPHHPRLAGALLGLVQTVHVDRAEGLRLLQRAIDIRERALGEDNPDVAMAYNVLANFQRSHGDADTALGIYERVIGMLERSMGPEHPDVAAALNNLCIIYEERGQLDDALSCYQRALRISVQARGEEHREVATIHNNLGMVIAGKGDVDGAMKQYRLALDVRRRLLGPRHSEVAATLNNMASLSASGGAYEDARRWFEEALAIWLDVEGEQGNGVATCMGNLGTVHGLLGHPEEALQYWERALALRQRIFEPDHPVLAYTLEKVGGRLEALGRRDAARERYEEALRLRERGKPEPVETARVRLALANVLWPDRPSRPRALELARTAADELATAGEPAAAEHAAARTWLRRHGG